MRFTSKQTKQFRIIIDLNIEKDEIITQTSPAIKNELLPDLLNKIAIELNRRQNTVKEFDLKGRSN